MKYSFQSTSIVGIDPDRIAIQSYIKVSTGPLIDLTNSLISENKERAQPKKTRRNVAKKSRFSEKLCFIS